MDGGACGGRGGWCVGQEEGVEEATEGGVLYLFRGLLSSFAHGSLHGSGCGGSVGGLAGRQGAVRCRPAWRGAADAADQPDVPLPSTRRP